jgi:hypothetical protein
MGVFFEEAFSASMSRGTPAAVATHRGVTTDVPGGRHILLRGSNYDMGLQRGQAFAQDLHAAFKTRVTSLFPQYATQSGGLWRIWAPLLKPDQRAFTRMANLARPDLSRVSKPVLEELAGMADGAKLPFDAVWLLQDVMDMSDFSPDGVMFAAVGNRAGADDLLVGRNFSWTSSEVPVLIEMHPEVGHQFVHAGFPWNGGAFSGMNDAGLVLCADRRTGTAHGPGQAKLLPVLLRELLQTADDVDVVIADLLTQSQFDGWDVLVAGFSNQGAKAVVVEFRDQVSIRPASGGILLGGDSDDSDGEVLLSPRYARLSALVEEERIVGRSDIERMLSDGTATQSAPPYIWNESVCQSIVFEPGSRKMHVAFRGPGGKAGPFRSIILEGGSAHE